MNVRQKRWWLGLSKAVRHLWQAGRIFDEVPGLLISCVEACPAKRSSAGYGSPAKGLHAHS